MSRIIPILILITAAAGPEFARAKHVALKATTLGNVEAPVGGTLYRSLAAEPETFNPLNSTSVYSGPPVGAATESLLGMNPETYEMEPGLADGYDVSADFLTYRLTVNPLAHFSDGTPVTAEDVQFSLTYMQDPAFQAANKMPYYEGIKSVTVQGPRTVEVKMKRRYFQNLEIVGGAPILPKHVYADPKTKFPKHPIFGSGPYKVDQYNRGQNIIMTRDPNYWGRDLPSAKGSNKFDRLSFRFVKDEGLRFEMLKRGQIDYLDDVSAEAFETRAVGEPFGTKVKKMQIEDSAPQPWGFVAWNYRDPEDLTKPHPILADRDVRHALSLLLNRKLLIDKFMFGKEVEARGPALARSPMLDSDIKPVEYDFKAARTLLKQAGWEDRDQDGVLEKTIDGRKRELKITLLLARREIEKYMTIYKEDLRKAGIILDIKLIEWSTFVKVIGEHKFDAITLRWSGGGKESDLKQVWHSESAKNGGSNFISYANARVDKAIDQARGEMDTAKRMALWRQATRLIVEDHAYTYLFNPKYDLFLINDRIGFDRARYEYGGGLGQYWVKK